MKKAFEMIAFHPSFNDARKKLWHAVLFLGVAYAQHDERLAWSVPALVAIASMSDAPMGGVVRPK